MIARCLTCILSFELRWKRPLSRHNLGIISVHNRRYIYTFLADRRVSSNFGCCNRRMSHVSYVHRIQRIDAKEQISSLLKKLDNSNSTSHESYEIIRRFHVVTYCPRLFYILIVNGGLKKKFTGGAHYIFIKLTINYIIKLFNV